MAAITAIIGLLASLVLGVPGTAAQNESETVEALVRLRGTTGTELVTVDWSGGAELARANLSADWTTISLRVPTSAQWVRVNFVNDSLPTDSFDRNVIVDWFEIAGNTGAGVTRIQTESDQVFSLGVWNGTDCAAGFRTDEFLACNGFFQYDVDDLVDPPPDDSEQIIVTAAETRDGVRLAVSVDGVFLETFELSGVLTDYTMSIPAVESGPLRVEYYTDAITSSGDRDAYIPTIKFRDVTYDTKELYSKGVWNGTDCGTGFRDSNTLNCNGWFQVPLDGDPPPPDGPTVQARVSAFGTTGTELLALEVNGETVDTWTVNNQMARTFDVPVPDEGFNQVRILYLNDGLDESGVDRNVRMDLIEFNRTTYYAVDLLSKGTWNGTDCGEGFRNSSWLHCNGWFDLGIGG